MIKLLLVVLLVWGTSLQAYEERTFDNAKQEAVFDSLAKELRCLVCQNQNIADSDAELAVDLRREIYTMLKDGKTKSDIREFMVARYGEFVLYKPRFSVQTLVLWLGPGLLLLIGGVILYRSTASVRKPTENPIADAALTRARNLLDED